MANTNCKNVEGCDSCYYCYSCYGSFGLRLSERMIFCLGEGKYESKGEGYQKNNRIFNVEVSKDDWDKARASLPELKIAVTKWIDKADMTDKEKKDHLVYKEIGGFLKRFEYKGAWGLWWDDASKSDRQKILDLPHFNAGIFEEITGIKVGDNSKKRELLTKADELVAKAEELRKSAGEL